MKATYGEHYYHSLDYEMKKRFGRKVYRLSLDAGCTCPNRDGTLGLGGCIFCADDSYAHSVLPVSEQIEEAKKKIASKTKDNAYIAYFQSHTNTYGDFESLSAMFLEAIEHPEVVVLSVATRPDCIDDRWVEKLSELNRIKPVWVELGLQTVNDSTAELINRGYSLNTFETAYMKLRRAGLEVIVHIMVGLPGETSEDARKTVAYLAGLKPVLNGIKIHNLNVLKGTILERMLTDESSQIPAIHNYEPEEYLELVIELLDMLPDETVVHRITGDGQRKLLVSPLWITDKKRVQNTFRKMLIEKRTK